jgi:hypothetical protein
MRLDADSRVSAGILCLSYDLGKISPFRIAHEPHDIACISEFHASLIVVGSGIEFADMSLNHRSVHCFHPSRPFCWGQQKGLNPSVSSRFQHLLVSMKYQYFNTANPRSFSLSIDIATSPI